MQYNDFKGEKISALGFGLMRLPVIGGEENQSDVDIEKVRELVKYAVDTGVNYFDTAYVYHNGFSEIVLGQILEEEGLRDKVNIATKMFTLGVDRPGFSPQAMFDEQLERLRTDCIDFYLIHGLQGTKWDLLRDKFDIVNHMNKLKAEGKVRYMGFSFHDNLPAFKHIIDEYDWDFCQIQFNYIDYQTQAGEEGLAYAREKGVKVAIMEPIKGGSLVFPDNPDVDRIMTDAGLSGETPAELAFRYVADQEGLLTILSGMNAMSQLTENIATFDKAVPGCLTDAEKKAIEDLRAYINRADEIPCTTCRYCTRECPNEINIPAAFSVYNNSKRYGNPKSGLRNYNRSCANIKDCVECGSCIDACPQKLNIPELLKQVREYFENA